MTGDSSAPEPHRRRPRYRGTHPRRFAEKYKEQVSTAGVKGSTTPVKSRKPNAWGLYDMLCGGWHLTSNYKVDNARVKEIDPQGPSETAA